MTFNDWIEEWQSYCRQNPTINQLRRAVRVLEAAECCLAVDVIKREIDTQERYAVLHILRDGKTE